MINSNWIKPFGESALIINFPFFDNNGPDQIYALGSQLQSYLKPYITSYIPSIRSLVICFDSYLISYDNLSSMILEINPEFVSNPLKKKHVLPISFDKKYALDLHLLLKENLVPMSEVLDELLNKEYEVLVKGFLPGFAYMGYLEIFMGLEKRVNPRKKVLQGSVGISGRHLGIYPIDSPGGWNIIGHCPTPLIDINDNDTGLLNPGDTVQFVRI